ncbi:D-hexose-6-phosphate mutarotase [Verrucomicrobiota bacterium sgz303538]
MPVTAAELRNLEMPQIAEFRDGPGGLVFLDIHSSLAKARIFLHGAHVTHFEPTGEPPVLFLSEASHFSEGKPIRGGVPVIFPWFGPRSGFPDAPAHGFARVLPWRVESLSQVPSGEVTMVLILESSEQTRSQWAHDFALRHIITVGSTLSMTLTVENRSQTAFTFEEALHTYLAVEDVRDVSVTGLSQTTYIDKVDGFKRKTQDAGPIRITAETDRIYLNTETSCTVDDPRAGRCILVEKEGSDTTVVWNPWIAKAAAMSDFGNDEWPRMLCIETTNAADNAVTLPPGSTHEMRAVISVQR